MSCSTNLSDQHQQLQAIDAIPLNNSSTLSASSTVGAFSYQEAPPVLPTVAPTSVDLSHVSISPASNANISGDTSNQAVFAELNLASYEDIVRQIAGGSGANQVRQGSQDENSALLPMIYVSQGLT